MNAREMCLRTKQFTLSMCKNLINKIPSIQGASKSKSKDGFDQ